MKRFLLWKYLDLAVQLAMLFPLIYFTTDARPKAFLAYFTVGGWQLASCLMTVIAAEGRVSAARKLYGKWILWLVIVLLGCGLLAFADSSVQSGKLTGIGNFFAGVAYFELIALVFIGPIFAIWYFWMTLEELGVLKAAILHRSEVHWKL